jgi:glyoxylase-like metal-dependent hydrolase (beta-lactamase superfamily II)
MNREIKTFYDTRTNTLTYLVYDPESKDAVVIDPVLDYDPAASKTWTESVDEVIEFVRANDLNLHYILETHAHADHLSGAQRIKAEFGDVKLAIGARITEVQSVFKNVFGLDEGFQTDGSQFDELLSGGSVTKAGTLEWETIATPGHTPACVTFKFDDAIFTGDALFNPDSGTGRCDFPGGSATDLYHSVHDVLYALPDDTEVYVGHDYQPGGREVLAHRPLAEHKVGNVALPASRSMDDFVSWREARDATLNAPRLLFQSVQVNVDGGRLPEPETNETRYLRIPINVFRPPVDESLLEEAEI